MTRRRHPLRRWWVYCLIAWALATTTVGHAVVGTGLTLLAQAWLRELVLLVALAALASWIACGTWRAGRRAARRVATIARSARQGCWHARHRARCRKARRAFAATRSEIRRLPTAGARR